MKSFHEPFSSLNARHLTCLLRQEFDTFYAVVLLTSKFSQLHYRPQIPLREGNVFTGVCLFTGSGVTPNALSPHGRVLPCIRPRPPLHIRHGEHPPPAIWWWVCSLETCSNLFIWRTPREQPLVMATETEAHTFPSGWYAS